MNVPWYKREYKPKKSRRSYDYDDYGGYDYSFGTTKPQAGWYYYEPPLSESYIAQIVAALASQHKVTIERGDGWATDVKAKKLVYNSAALRYKSRVELLSCILHEVGHLRYTSPYDELGSPYVEKYGEPAKLAVNVFEDFRVDDLMMKAYPVGGEIRQAFEGDIMNYAEVLRQRGASTRKERLMKITELKVKLQNGEMDELEKLFKTKDAEKIKTKLAEIKAEQSQPSIEEYCAEILYQEARGGMVLDKVVEPYVEKTKHFIGLAPSYPRTLELAKAMDEGVFPIIEPLLKTSSNSTARGVSPELAREIDVGKTITEMLSVRGAGNEVGRKPPPPRNYSELLNPLIPSIKKLVKLINRIRIAEQAIAYRTRQRSGKVEPRRLYRHRLDDFRLFRKRLPTQVYSRGLAFALYVDASGSMDGTNAVKATEAACILAEVGERCKIPTEIIRFTNEAKVLKTFSQPLGKKQKGKLMQLLYTDGGTRVLSAWQTSKIREVAKPHRFVFAITDGGDTSGEEVNREMPASITPVQVFIGASQADAERIAYFRRITTTQNASELPDILADIITKAVTQRL